MRSANERSLPSHPRQLIEETYQVPRGDGPQSRRRNLPDPPPHRCDVEILGQIDLGERHRTATHAKDHDGIDKCLFGGGETRAVQRLPRETAEAVFVDVVHCEETDGRHNLHGPAERHEIHAARNLVDHCVSKESAIHRDVVGVGAREDWSYLIDIGRAASHPPHPLAHALDHVGLGESRQCLRRTRWGHAPHGGGFCGGDDRLVESAECGQGVDGPHEPAPMALPTSAAISSLTVVHMFSHCSWPSYSAAMSGSKKGTTSERKLA